MARTHGRGGAGIRKTNKKGATKGSGGQRRKGLAGKGPTPKAEDRIYHAKHKAKLERDRRNSGRHQKETAEMVVGRNPVIECLHAKVPATTLYIVAGTRNDKRLSEAVAMCNTRNIPIIEVQRHEMDRMTGNGMHQGIGLKIQPYKYADFQDLLESVDGPGMFVVLKGHVAQQQKFNIEMASHTITTENPEGFPGISFAYTYGEESARGMYRYWTQIMTAPDWPSIREIKPLPVAAE